MPASAYLTFTALTDPLIWFESVDAFNEFMAGITVSIAYTNLPLAALTTVGAVKLATIPGYVPEVLVPAYVSFIDPTIPDAPVTNTVADSASFDAVVTKLNNVSAKLDALMDAMAAAGQLQIT